VSDAITGAAALDLAATQIDELLATSSARVIVGIVVPPATGKSTFAARLCERLGAPLLPMDGFHLSNRQLSRLGRRDRKGAPDTFDVDGYLATLHRVVADDHDVYAPEFDRALDESVAAGLVILAESRLVITEGNYLALADGAWGSVRGAIDRLYYLDSPSPTRRDRLVARHVEGGRSVADAERWVDLVDEPNAALIAGTEINCDATLLIAAP
jgi:pantothenate kinase